MEKLKSLMLLGRTAAWCLLSLSVWAQDATGGPEAGAEGPEAAFAAGTAAYAEGRYDEAAAQFEAVLVDHNHFESHYNLGNVRFKQGRLGEAILHYERARQLRPEDDDTANNLALARSQVVDRIEPLPTMGLRDLWSRVVAKGRLGFWRNSFLTAWLLGWALLAIRLRARELGLRRLWGTLGTVSLSLSLLLGGLAYATYQRAMNSREAIILDQIIEVQSAPQSADALPLFILHEGTKVRMLQEQSGWWEVEIANGNVGWLPSSALEAI
jgi:tetratricopeptide (TPR) repeat protein